VIRPHVVPVWTVFLAALALRAGWVGCAWIQAGPALAYPDEALHWQLARNLVQHGALVSDDGRYAARMPLYPLFLAPLAACGELGVLLARLTQALLSAATVGLVATWVRQAAGARAATLAGMLVALDPFAIFFSNLLLTEALFTFALVSAVASAWRWAQAGQPPWRDALLLALAGAALVLIRPSAALLAPLLWLAAAGGAWRDRRRLAGLALSPVVLVAALLPWGWRNQAVLGAPAWLSTNGGVTLYDAQGPQADGSSNQEFLRQIPGLTALGEIERDRRLRDLAGAQMRRAPARAVSLAFTKFARMWNPFPNVAEHRRGAAAWAGGVYSIAVYGLALASAATLRRRTPGSLRRLHALACLTVVYFALLHMAYIGSVRYRVPVMPLLVAAGATIVAREYGAARGREGGAGVLAAPAGQADVHRTELRGATPGLWRARPVPQSLLLMSWKSPTRPLCCC
jgi:4-amino-4-deoxy-L-arabinose transferase-like glycosyltransferase